MDDASQQLVNSLMCLMRCPVIYSGDQWWQFIKMKFFIFVVVVFQHTKNVSSVFIEHRQVVACLLKVLGFFFCCCCFISRYTSSSSMSLVISPRILVSDVSSRYFIRPQTAINFLFVNDVPLFYDRIPVFFFISPSSFASWWLLLLLLVLVR